MVVTSMASRGLDFPGLDAVFNLSLPEDEVDYAHRWALLNCFQLNMLTFETL